MKLIVLAATLTLIVVAVVGLAQAAQITLKSDATTLGSPMGLGYPDVDMLARLDAGDTTGLVFSPVILDSFGSWTTIPPGAPLDTAVVNISGGSDYDGENGFFKMAFDLPSSFANIQLTGSANVDDFGRLFLNGNPLTPSLSSGSPGVISETGNVTFESSNPAFFKAGTNVILIADANTGGGPSAGAFFVNISYSSGAIPAATLLLLEN